MATNVKYVKTCKCGCVVVNLAPIDDKTGEDYLGLERGAVIPCFKHMDILPYGPGSPYAESVREADPTE